MSIDDDAKLSDMFGLLFEMDAWSEGLRLPDAGKIEKVKGILGELSDDVFSNDPNAQSALDIISKHTDTSQLQSRMKSLPVELHSGRMTALREPQAPKPRPVVNRPEVEVTAPSFGEQPEPVGDVGFGGGFPLELQPYMRASNVQRPSIPLQATPETIEDSPMPALFDQILQDNGINLGATTQNDEILGGAEPAALPEDAPLPEITEQAPEGDLSVLEAGLAEEVVDSPEPDSTKEPESKYAGFENVLSKIGLVVASLSAAKGNTAPLEMLLATRIGKNKALELAKNNKATEAERKRKTQTELAKHQLDVKEFERKKAKDEADALRLNKPKIQVIEGIPYLIDPMRPEELNKIDGFDKKKNWAQAGKFWWEEQPDGTQKPVRAITDREVNWNGEYITENKVIGGETLITANLSDIGRVRKNQMARGLFKDDVDYGMKALDMNFTLANAQEREDSIRTVASAIETAKRTGRLTASQVTTLNQFIRNVDEGATVRSNDIELVESGQSTMDKINTAFERAGQQDMVVNQALVEDMVNMLLSLTEVRRNSRRDIFEGELSAFSDGEGELVVGADALKVIRSRGENMYFGSQAEFNREFLLSDDTPSEITAVDKAIKENNLTALRSLARSGSVYAKMKMREIQSRANR